MGQDTITEATGHCKERKQIDKKEFISDHKKLTQLIM